MEYVSTFFFECKQEHYRGAIKLTIYIFINIFPHRGVIEEEFTKHLY